MTQIEDRALRFGCPRCGRATYHRIFNQDFEGAGLTCLSCGHSYWTARSGYEGYMSRLWAENALPRFTGMSEETV